jgi:NADPH-dependent 2,4-dienoyl-CoA reductase/sulfur reductase-like enzyme
MEAAWVAAARGHDVELFETKPQLGGQMNWLRHMPKRNDFLTMIDQQIAACERHGVTIRTSTKFDANATIEQEQQPDHIVIATGSELRPVEFPQGGVGLTLGEALSTDWTSGVKVAFYDLLGDWSSISVVEHIADLGADVTYLTPVAGYAWRITRYSKTAITARLREAGVEIRLLRAGLSFIGN